MRVMRLHRHKRSLSRKLAPKGRETQPTQADLAQEAQQPIDSTQTGKQKRSQGALFRGLCWLLLPYGPEHTVLPLHADAFLLPSPQRVLGNLYGRGTRHPMSSSSFRVHSSRSLRILPLERLVGSFSVEPWLGVQLLSLTPPHLLPAGGSRQGAFALLAGRKNHFDLSWHCPGGGSTMAPPSRRPSERGNPKS